jgi:N-acetylneuraminic acid mutarotase
MKAETWEPLPPLPAPNGGSIVASQDGKIWMIGGTNWEGGSKNWLNTVNVFDPKKLAWTTLDALPSPIAYGLAVQGDKMPRLFGGSDGKQSLKQVPGMPGTVVLSAGGAVEDSVVMIGGTDDAANIAGVSRTAFLITGQKVEKLPDYPGEPFAVAASAVVGDEVFVMAGMNHDAVLGLPVNTNEAWALSVSKRKWRKLSPYPQRSRGVGAVVLDQDHLYVGGGFNEAFTAEAFIYQISNNRWTKAPPFPQAGMAGMILHEGYVYILGGEDKMKSRTDQCWRIKAELLLKK